MASSSTVKYSGSKIARQSDFRVGATVREHVIGVTPVRRSTRLAQQQEARVEKTAVIPVARSLTRSVEPANVSTNYHHSPPVPVSHHTSPTEATGKDYNRALTQTLGLRAATNLSEIKFTARIVLERCDRYIPPQPPAAARECEHDISRQETRTANPPPPPPPPSTKTSSAENT